MKKKIYAVCALVLIAAMFFSFAACDAGTTDTEQTTVAAMSEMPVGKEVTRHCYYFTPLTPHIILMERNPSSLHGNSITSTEPKRNSGFM